MQYLKDRQEYIDRYDIGTIEECLKWYWDIVNNFKKHRKNKEFVDNSDEEFDFEVVRSKKFAIKPMAVEEAILQMNLLGHSFFMFSNSDSKKVNVVYRRKAGNYGLIEPEF